MKQKLFHFLKPINDGFMTTMIPELKVAKDEETILEYLLTETHGYKKDYLKLISKIKEISIIDGYEISLYKGGLNE